MKTENRSSKPYRPCIVGVFVNGKKEVLVAKRSDTGTWQFPQGGVEEGESLVEALFREMKEEIGCDQFELIDHAETKLYYDFPDDYKGPLFKKYRGQEQSWYLCKFKDGYGPELESSSSNEFVQIKWVPASEIVSTIVSWKKDTYSRGLTLLGLL